MKQTYNYSGWGVTGYQCSWTVKNEHSGDSFQLSDEEKSHELAELLNKLGYQIEELKRQLTVQSANNYKRNIQLDALHFVWCTAACDGGDHWYTPGALTEEIVQEAERNTQRMRQRWNNLQAKKKRGEVTRG